MSMYLRHTEVFDWDVPEVSAYAAINAGNSDVPGEKAVKLYYAVRDDIRYDPYTLDLSVPSMRASTTLSEKRGWCVTKAVLLASCCRSLGIPARLGFADVRNHLSTARMRALMKTDIFYWHGYASIYLEGVWVKATPAFNIGLCEKFRIRPLEFDGRNDSTMHPFDLEGKRHMEYLAYRGEYADVPVDLMMETFLREYPVDQDWKGSNFDAEVDKEVGEVGDLEK
ncbi:transglutaminase family protein [archaeon]|nr:transglutaminase family protein [archaeon]